MMKVINFFGGPGSGKSRTATSVFSRLKDIGVNAEYVPEYAKDASWENRGQKFFRAQQHIYGEQSWRLERLVGDVEIAITDAPLPISLAYFPEGFKIPSLREAILEDFGRYDNLNFFLKRSGPYNPKGRSQDLEQAKALDDIIMDILKEEGINFHVINCESGMVTQKVMLAISMLKASWGFKLQENIVAYSSK